MAPTEVKPRLVQTLAGDEFAVQNLTQFKILVLMVKVVLNPLCGFIFRSLFSYGAFVQYLVISLKCKVTFVSKDTSTQ